MIVVLVVVMEEESSRVEVIVVVVVRMSLCVGDGKKGQSADLFITTMADETEWQLRVSMAPEQTHSQNVTSPLTLTQSRVPHKLKTHNIPALIELDAQVDLKKHPRKGWIKRSTGSHSGTSES
jgi:hypothetical protein